jgi:hypothetical protein
MAGIHSGEVAYAIFNGVLASLVVVWVLLRLYRRAVEKTMRTTVADGGNAVHAVPAPVARPPAAPSAGARSSTEVRGRLAVAYGLALALSALALAVPELREFRRDASGGMQVALQTFVIGLTNASPAIVLIGFLVAAPARRIFIAFVIVWIAGCLLTVGIPVIARMIAGRLPDVGLAMNAYYFTIALALNCIAAARARVPDRTPADPQRDAARARGRGAAEPRARLLRRLAQGECRRRAARECVAGLGGRQLRGHARAGALVPGVEPSGGPAGAGGASAASPRATRQDDSATCS